MVDSNQNNSLDDNDYASDMICFCFGVSREAIVQAVLDNNLKGIDQITKYTHARGGCKGCQPDIRCIIDETRRKNSLDQKEQARWERKKVGTDNVPLIKKIRIIKSVVQEIQKSHFSRLGISVELVDINAEQVAVCFKSNASESREDEIAWAQQLQSAINKELKNMVVTVKD